MSELTVKRRGLETPPVRITVFPDDPDFLLICCDEDGTVDLPLLEAPFTKAGVAQACGDAGAWVRVVAGIAGRFTPAMRASKQSAKAERTQKQNQLNATRSSLLLSAGNEETRKHAETLTLKQKVDDEIREIKLRLADAKDVLFRTGKRMPQAEYRQLDNRLQELKQESQALQTLLGQLREQEKARNREESNQEYSRRLLAAARRLLDADTYQRLIDAAGDDE